MTGNNTTYMNKSGQGKRHILTDKKGIPLSAVITSANNHNIKAVIDVLDNSFINLHFESSFSKKKTRRQNCQQQHLCLDSAYSSKSTKNEIINRGYVPHIPYKRKRGQIKKEKTYKKQYSYAKNKRWVV
jgi:putative transposase